MVKWYEGKFKPVQDFAEFLPLSTIHTQQEDRWSIPDLYEIIDEDYRIIAEGPVVYMLSYTKNIFYNIRNFDIHLFYHSMYLFSLTVYNNNYVIIVVGVFLESTLWKGI